LSVSSRADAWICEGGTASERVRRLEDIPV
jgi:hypothetical protein